LATKLKFSPQREGGFDVVHEEESWFNAEGTKSEPEERKENIDFSVRSCWNKGEQLQSIRCMFVRKTFKRIGKL